MGSVLPISRFTSLILKVRRLDWRDRLLFADALMSLSVASALIRFAPFERAVRFGTELGRDTGIDPRRITRSVEAVAARLPWRALCFQQGLAARWMLRRRGVDARLHYGVARAKDEKLEAHVWITVDCVAVIGGEEADRFREIASFPAPDTTLAHGK